MRDVLTALLRHWHAGQTAGLATVVRTQKSAPRPVGTSMLVTPEGAVVGSVSGGCVEGAVYELAQQVVSDGRPVIEQFGYSDEDAFAVGLTCGGTIDVFIEPVSAVTFADLEAVANDLDAGLPLAVATVIESDDPTMVGRHLMVHPDRCSGTLGAPDLDNVIAADARELLATGTSSTLTYGADDERMPATRVFVASHQPDPRMIIFGALDFGVALAELGSFLGFNVTVCDARPVFATRTRFPMADDVEVAWPHVYLEKQIEAGAIDNRTVICVLTHDAKFDVPLLLRVLSLEGDARPAYVGAMGSRVTHEDRTKRLLEAGLDPHRLERLSSPIGLDLGGNTTEEAAVSICAEIIAIRHGGQGMRLSESQVRIHR